MRSAVLSRVALLLGLLIAAVLPTAARGNPPPEQFRIGAYVTAIHAIDTAAGTFDADLWLWSVGTSPTRDPLQTMEFVNSDRIARRLQSTTQRGPLYWRQAKVVGTFRHAWDLQHFPFDTQHLQITFEEGIDDARALIYTADTPDTGFMPDAAPPGWRITGLKVSADVKHYPTSFGDPTDRNKSDYTRLRLDITLQRASLSTFLNLAAPVYAAFLLCMVSFLMHQETRAMVESRVAILAGALFAIVLNMRAVSGFLGNEHHLTVVDRLNIVVLAYIVFATLVTVASGIAHNRGRPLARRFDYACSAVIALSFVAINVVLIAGVE